MVKFDFLESVREIVLKLRTNISDPLNRTTETTENFTGDGAQLEFELQDDIVNGKHTIQHIISIKFDGDLKIPWLDYNYYIDSTNAGKIIFITEPDPLVDIEIIYHKGARSWIYPDFPALSVNLTEYPRIAVDIIGGNSKVEAIGAESLDSSFMVEIVIFAPEKRQLENLYTEVRNWIIDNGKTFQNFRFITPRSVSPYIVDPSRVDRVFQRAMNLEIQLQEEN